MLTPKCKKSGPSPQDCIPAGSHFWPPPACPPPLLVESFRAAPPAAQGLIAGLTANTLCALMFLAPPPPAPPPPEGWMNSACDGATGKSPRPLPHRLLHLPLRMGSGLPHKVRRLAHTPAIAPSPLHSQEPALHWPPLLASLRPPPITPPPMAFGPRCRREGDSERRQGHAGSGIFWRWRGRRPMIILPTPHSP